MQHNSPISLSIQLLGSFQLTYNGAATTKPLREPLQLLLAHLLLQRGRIQPRDRVATLLWPASSDKQARSNLRTLLKRLKDEAPALQPFLFIEKSWLAWRTDWPFQLDVAEFEGALQQAEVYAQQGKRAKAIDLLQHTLNHYSAELLPEFYVDWVLDERERLENLAANATRWLVTLLKEEGAFAQALYYARHLLRRSPVCEAAYYSVIELYWLNGDRAGALRAYTACRLALQESIGIDPGPAVAALHQQIQMGAAHPVVTPSVPPVAPPTPRLVGRASIWQACLTAWEQVTPGQPHCLLMRGEPGLGKTRLLAELHKWADVQQIPCAATECHALVGAPDYAPLVSWLRSPLVQQTLPTLDFGCLAELACFVPELYLAHPDLPGPAPCFDAEHLAPLFHALVCALCANRSALLLLIDDLHWCDAATLAWLDHLFQSRLPIRLLLVGAFCTQAGQAEGETQRLAEWLAQRRRLGQVTMLELPHLDVAATTSLAKQVTGHRLPATLMAQLHEITEGNPLLIIETLLAHCPPTTPTHQGNSAARAMPVALALPASQRVQTLRETYLLNLSPAATDLLELLALMSEEVAVTALVALYGSEASLPLEALEELCARGLLCESSTGVFRLCHRVLRTLISAQIAPARRGQIEELLATVD